MFNCYTLTRASLERGIRTDVYECTVHTGTGNMSMADLLAVPVLPSNEKAGDGPCLVFVSPASGGEPAPGAIISADPMLWTAGADKGVVLIDTSMDCRHVLLFIPPDTDMALTGPSSKPGDACVLSTDSSGTPRLVTSARGGLLLASLGRVSQQPAASCLTAKSRARTASGTRSRTEGRTE